MRAFWIFVIIASVMVGWYGGEASSAGPTKIPDVSWPNCGIKLARAPAGIVGVTGGLALRPNPCLAAEAANYKNLSVYVNTGYPGLNVASKLQTTPKDCAANDKVCRAYNYGYNSGRYAVDYSLRSGVVAKKWWLDVETENSWNNDIKVNRAALSGMLDSVISFAGKNNVGFYSYPGQWDLLTGHWRNNYPAWAATGSTKLVDAIDACRAPSFSGGPVLLAQYTPNLDTNYICR